jgi:hypothetical protein
VSRWGYAGAFVLTVWCVALTAVAVHRRELLGAVAWGLHTLTGIFFLTSSKEDHCPACGRRME